MVETQVTKRKERRELVDPKVAGPSVDSTLSPHSRIGEFDPDCHLLVTFPHPLCSYPDSPFA